MKKLLRSALTVSTLLGAMGCAAAFAADSAAADRLSIKYHESLPAPQIEAGGAAQQADGRRQAQSAAPAGATTLKFFAFGKAFEVVLEPNHKVTADLPQAQQRRLAGKVQLLRGKLAGNDKSWARLAQAGQKLSGMIWDGNEVYLIDSSDDIAEALAAKPPAPQTLIYRLSDVAWNAQCALAPNAAPVTDYRGLVQELQESVQALPAATRQLSVAVVADTQFVALNSADPEAAVMARMNVVDGIYTEQVGVDLRVAQIRSLSSNGTLTSTDPGALLSAFGSFAGSSGFNNPGLAHLFTGKDLNGSTVGIAYLASLCSPRFGSGVSQLRGSGSAGALIVAHEMGHNFGAPHDNQGGSPCASTPGTFIMNPSVNGSDQFSQCSLNQMAPVVANANCVTNITPATGGADVKPALPVNPINAAAGANFRYQIEVLNSGNGSANRALALVSIPRGLQLQSAQTTLGACTSSATLVTCRLGTLAAAGRATITLTLRGAAGRFVSRINTGATNDANRSNNRAQTVIVLSAR